jgi:OPA family glycerol-3-phosphate transporter-like MFS transporter 1/2
MPIIPLSPIQLRAFLVTFLAYTTIHLVRKPSSVLKSVLHPEQKEDNSAGPGWAPFNQDVDTLKIIEKGIVVSGMENKNGLYNGHYDCVMKTEQHCTEYMKSNNNPSSSSNSNYVVARIPAAYCIQHVDSNYDKDKYCWIIHATPKQQLSLDSTSTAIATTADYVQLWNGTLPQFKKKSWKEFKSESNVYIVNKNVIVEADVTDGKFLLGILDSVFLFSYTFGLVVSGYVADRVDIRKFLTLGMIGAGLCSISLGFSHRVKIHQFSYFFIVNMFAGLFQSIAWPCVITIMSRFFPIDYPRRGFIMGVWNSHISFGNVLGSIIATAGVSWGMEKHDWPLGYEIPGIIVICGGIIVWVFLETNPGVSGSSSSTNQNDDLESSLLQHQQQQQPLNSATTTDALPPTITTATTVGDITSLFRALKIPGVIEFCFALCFAKLGAYALLFWGPLYLNHVGFTSEKAGYLCSFFDLGGLLGGIGAGLLSDIGRKRGTVNFIFLAIACPLFYVYYASTNSHGPNIQLNIWMMIIIGFFVNGPVALITTAVTADLGQHESLLGSEDSNQLMAQVAGLIDGAGSFGAAVQGVVIGLLSTEAWKNVYIFLSFTAGCGALFLTRIVRKEMSM